MQLSLSNDGELLVRGPIVTAGYHHDPVRTAEAIDLEGWPRTGDLGAIDEDGLGVGGRLSALCVGSVLRGEER